jgi:release factor glutamine methyltransferase
MSNGPLSELALPPAQRSAVVARLRSAGCVFAEDEAAILMSAAATLLELDAMVEQRADGTPIEYVVGWAEFCGLRVCVEPGVFVPRRRSEFLVQQAVAFGRADGSAVVLDLCCGSGAIGLAVASKLANVELYASDLDPVAVRCASRNIAAIGAHVYQSDLFADLPSELRGRVDLLLANVPYVPTDDIELLPAEARLHEARVALDGGIDGLDVLRRVTAAARKWLVPGGRVLFETTEHQAAAAAQSVTGEGLIAAIASDDEWGATVVIGARPGRSLTGSVRIEA